MKVSIITVTFNSEKYLEQSILSLLEQTYKNIEYIIIDGNSTDNTLSIIKKYENHIDKFVCEMDNGMFDALNKGMSIATGDIIGVLHSDDIFNSSDVIESVVRAFEENKVKSFKNEFIINR